LEDTVVSKIERTKMDHPRHPGRKSFLSGAIVLLLFGAVHLLAVYKANFTTPTDPKLAEIDAAEKALTVSFGPLTATGFGLIQILNCSYSVLLIYAGVLNLLAMRPAISTGRLKALTACNVIFVGLLLAIIIFFQFPPPMLFAGLALIFFVASWAKQR